MSAWTRQMEPGPALLILVLVLCPQLGYSAPFEESTEIEYYPVADATGCYYNFEHYDEGDRIITNEPCLNCTCHNRMLMCYLRVCPFTKAIGQDCKVEKKSDQCCPVITCPEVPVHLVPQTSTPSTALGHLNEYGCSIDNLFYADGAKVPSNPNNPCEVCYCIRNRTACIIQECTLTGKVAEGCRPVYIEGVCCPLRYDCDHPEIETTPRPLLTSTTTTTTTTTTTIIPPTSAPTDCIYNNQVFIDGAMLKKDVPCEKCYCMKGDIICAVQKCGPTPLDKVNCTALPIKEGQCCPDTYDCDMVSEEDLTTLSYYDVPTTQPTIIDLGTGATVSEEDEKAQTTKAPVELVDRDRFIPEVDVVTEEAAVTATTPAAIATRITEAVTEIVEAITSSIFGTTEQPEKEQLPEKEYKKPAEEGQIPEKETEKPLDEQEKPTDEEDKPTDEKEKPSDENVTQEHIADDSEVTVTEGTVKQPVTEAALSQETEQVPEQKPDVVQEPEITPTESEEHITTEDSVKAEDEHSFETGVAHDDFENGEDNEVTESDVKTTGKPEVSTTVVSSSEDAHTRPIDQEKIPSQGTVEEKETTTTPNIDESADTVQKAEPTEATQGEKLQTTTQQSFAETAVTEKAPPKAVSDESNSSTSIPVEPGTVKSTDEITVQTADNELDETVTQKPIHSQEEVSETPSVGLPVVTEKTEEIGVEEGEKQTTEGADIVNSTELPTEGAKSGIGGYTETPTDTNDQEVTEEPSRITLAPQKDTEGVPDEVTESQLNQEHQATITEKAITEIPAVTETKVDESKPESDTVTESQPSKKGQETTETSVITEAPKAEEKLAEEITEETPAVTETVIESQNEPESGDVEKIHVHPTAGVPEDTDVSVTESPKEEEVAPHVEEHFTEKTVTEIPSIIETQEMDGHVPGHIDIKDGQAVTTEKTETEEEMEIVTGVPMKETEKPQSMDHVSETISPELESNEVEKQTPSVTTTEHPVVTQQVHTEEPKKVTEGVSEEVGGTESTKLSEESTELTGHTRTETVPEQSATEKKHELVTDEPPTLEEGSGQEEPTEDTEGSGEPETHTESYDKDLVKPEEVSTSELPESEPELVTDISTEPKHVHQTTSQPDEIPTIKSESLTESTQGIESTEKSIAPEEEAPLPSHDVTPEISEGGLDENVSENTEEPKKETTIASGVPKISEVTTQPGPEEETVVSQQPEETVTERLLTTSESTALPEKVAEVDQTEETPDIISVTTEKLKLSEPEHVDVTEPSSEKVDATEPSIQETTTGKTTIDHGVSGEAELPKEVIAESTQSPADTINQDEVVTEKSLTSEMPIETPDHTVAPNIEHEPVYTTEQPKTPEEHEPTKYSVGEESDIAVTKGEEEHGIPGEGSCLVDGQTYRNNSNVPPFNQCQLSCKCVSSILQCESVQCLAPPSNLEDCMPVFQSPGSCCPTYSCSVPSPTSAMESDSHVIETTIADREDDKHETTSQSVLLEGQTTAEGTIPTGDTSESPIHGETIEHGAPEIAVTSVPVPATTPVPAQEVTELPESTDNPPQENEDLRPVVHGYETEKPESTANGIKEHEKGSTEQPADEITAPVIPQEGTLTSESLDKGPQIPVESTPLPETTDTIASVTEEEPNEVKPSFDETVNEIPEEPVEEPHIYSEHCSTEGCAPVHPSVEVHVTEETVKETELPSVTKSTASDKEQEEDTSKPAEEISTPELSEKESETPKPVDDIATEAQVTEIPSTETDKFTVVSDLEQTTPGGESITKSAGSTPIPEKYPTEEISTAKPRIEPDSTDQLSAGQTTVYNTEHQTQYPVLADTKESGSETTSDHDKHPVETTVSEGDKFSGETTDASITNADYENESESSTVTESIPKETQHQEEGISEQKPEENVETTSEESSKIPEEGTELPKKGEIDTAPTVLPESITEKISEVLDEQNTEKIPTTTAPVQSSEKPVEQDKAQNATIEQVFETSTQSDTQTPELSTEKISEEQDEIITTVAPLPVEEHVPEHVIPSEEIPVKTNVVEEGAEGSTTMKPSESAEHVTKATDRGNDEQEDHVTPSEQKPITNDVTEGLPTVKPLDYITEYDDSRISKPLESADHVTEAIDQGSHKPEETTEVVHQPETESEKSVPTFVQEYSPGTEQTVHEPTKVTESIEVTTSSKVTDTPVESESPAHALDNKETGEEITAPEIHPEHEEVVTETLPGSEEISTEAEFKPAKEVTGIQTETEEVNTEKHLGPSEIVTEVPAVPEVATESQPESESEVGRPIESVIEGHPDSEGAVTETIPVEDVTKTQTGSEEGELTRPAEIATERHSESEKPVTETHSVEVITKSQPGTEGGETTKLVEIVTERHPEYEEAVTEIQPVEVITKSQSGIDEGELTRPVEIVTESHPESEEAVTETHPVEIVTESQPGSEEEKHTRPVETATVVTESQPGSGEEGHTRPVEIATVVPESHPESEESVTDIHPVVTESQAENEEPEHTEPVETVTFVHPESEEVVTEAHPVEVITKSQLESEAPVEIITEGHPDVSVTETHPAEVITESQPGSERDEHTRPVEIATEGHPESEETVTEIQPTEDVTKSHPAGEEIATETHPKFDEAVTETRPVEVITKSQSVDEGEEHNKPVEIATNGHPEPEESATEIQPAEDVTKSKPGSEREEHTKPVEIATEGHPASGESATEIQPVEDVTKSQPESEVEEHTGPVEVATGGQPKPDEAVTESQAVEVITKSHPETEGEEHTKPVEIATEGHPESETHPESEEEEPVEIATESHPGSDEAVTEAHPVEVSTKSKPESEVKEHTGPVEIVTEGHPESEVSVTETNPAEAITKSQPESEGDGPTKTVEIATEEHPKPEESVTETSAVDIVTEAHPESEEEKHTRPDEIATEGIPKTDESVTETHPAEVITKSQPEIEGEEVTRPVETATEGHPESVTESHPVEVITESQPGGVAEEDTRPVEVSVTETSPMEVTTKQHPKGEKEVHTEGEGEVHTGPAEIATEAHSETVESVTGTHTLEPVEIVTEMVTESRPDTGELVTDAYLVEITTKAQPENEPGEQSKPVDPVTETYPLEVVTKAHHTIESETTESFVKPEEEITEKQPGVEEVITETSLVPKETITVGPETGTEAEEVTKAHSVTEVDEKPLPGVEEMKTESPSGEIVTESVIQGVERKPEHENPILPTTEESFTSLPHLTTQAPRNDSELYTSGPTEEHSTKKSIEGELSTSVPISPAHTTSAPIQEPKPDHGIPGEHEHVPELPDYQSPGEDYDEEDQSPLGPGTCRYGGKVFVSAQQIPRDDPCDFCFCFRSDIICLQQSCPPPIPNCHEEPIRGFCCPRYECPVGMATSLNLTTTTTTTTTTLPPHFLAHAYKGMAVKNGCQVRGQAYRVGDYIKSASGPCMHCTCGADGKMKCDPKQCSPEPMLRQMIAAAASRRRR